MMHQHFTRNAYRRSTYRCEMCGKNTRDTGRGEAESDLCAACYEYAGWENSHSDNGHDASPDAGCPICRAKEPTT